MTVDYVATEVCTLNPTTSASCSLSLDMSASGEKTKTTSTYSFEGAEAEAQYFQVPITGGADKLRMAPTTCVSADNAAAPTRAARLYKVVVVPGAAALLAAGAAVL